MKLEIVSLALIFFAIIIIVLGIIKIHTYPGKVAKERNHPQLEAIEVTSLLGLIIFPFWMMALIWAYSGAVVGKLYIHDKKDEDETPDNGGLNDAALKTRSGDSDQTASQPQPEQEK